MKIRTAIFTVYVAVSGIAFAILMALILRDVRLRYVESMRRTLGDTAAFLAVLASEGTEGEAAWVAKLSTLPANTDFLRVFASGSDDEILFDSASGRDVGQRYAWPMRGGGRLASENYTLNNVAVENGELRVRAPIRHGSEIVGWVGVARPLSSVTEGVNQARERLVRYSAAIAIIMVFAGWWVASRLTRSLERLTAYVESMRDGRNATPPRTRAKEIATLARAFEQMRVSLEGKAHVERYTQALAHEIKAPLAAIQGAAELLQEEMPAEDRSRFLTNLRSESARLRQIVERMLELAALEARRYGSASADVDLGSLVHEVVERSKSVANARGIDLRSTRDGGPHDVGGDKFLLEQAISNLLQNALEFTPAGGAVTIALESTNERVAVVVEDTGPGVPEYAREKIFERFYSLPRADTGRKSSGLGLSIVREIARLHAGEIVLETSGGTGARFRLTLPNKRNAPS